MQTLNLKVVPDFSPRTTRKCFLRGNSVCGRREACLNHERKRNCRIVACSVEENGSGEGKSESLGSFLSRSQTYAMLRQQMEVAAQSEVIIISFPLYCSVFYGSY